mmetsp:Transcript_6022/g.12935  ORF Transcript_6022/g.12935 Transcript_6022/m.12935 type:complete len:120 (-) Transcript_6022:12-371(-)
MTCSNAKKFKQLRYFTFYYNTLCHSNNPRFHHLHTLTLSPKIYWLALTIILEGTKTILPPPTISNIISLKLCIQSKYYLVREKFHLDSIIGINKKKVKGRFPQTCMRTGRSNTSGSDST